jgi:hypothetical protein
VIFSRHALMPNSDTLSGMLCAESSLPESQMTPPSTAAADASDELDPPLALNRAPAGWLVEYPPTSVCARVGECRGATAPPVERRVAEADGGRPYPLRRRRSRLLPELISRVAARGRTR